MRDILFIRAQYTNDAGGIEDQILRIADELASRKLLNPILATDNREFAFAQSFAKRGFPVYEIPFKGRSLLSGAKAVEAILKKHDVAAVQSHMFRESIVGRIVRMRHPELPHIFRAHTGIDCSKIAAWKKTAYHLLDKATSGYVDQYIVSGPYLAEETNRRSWIPSGKIKGLNDGCNQPGEPDLPVDDPSSSLPPRIAMVSRFYPFKGHDVLIQALSLLKKRGIEITARLIGKDDSPIVNGSGDHEFTHNLKMQASQLGVLDQIEFFGFAPSLYDALRDWPVFVLPSDSEGIPIALIEALSLRKLAIASRVGGIPGVITDSVNGLLHPPKDPQAFADVLEKVFSAPAANWEPMRDAGLGVWKQAFSTEQLLDGLIESYRKFGIIT